jgi:flagellar basal-body rod protein FlgB
MKLFNQNLTTLERSLDVRLIRQNVLNSNLANLETPGYIARDVNFDSAMTVVTDGRAAIKATSDGHFDLGSEIEFEEILAEESPTNGSTIDGNTVDLDRTMAALSENATQYNVVAKAIGKKLAILRYVASDGYG